MSSTASKNVKERTDEDLAIRVQNMSKEFVLRHTRSMKEAFVWLVKGRKGDLTAKFKALNDVSFDIYDGETVALLGFNGSGKSTSLKMISGVLRPDEGRVMTRGRVAGLIEVGAGFHPDLSGRENVYLNAAILGMSKQEIQEQFDSIVAFSELHVIAGHSDDTFDEVFGGRVGQDANELQRDPHGIVVGRRRWQPATRILEDDDIAALESPELGHEHTVVHLQGVLHTPAGDEEHLRHERPQQRGDDQRPDDDDHGLGEQFEDPTTKRLLPRGFFDWCVVDHSVLIGIHWTRTLTSPSAYDASPLR